MKPNDSALDSRLMFYYDSKLKKMTSLLKDDVSEESRTAFYAGYITILMEVIQDLNNASMGAAFDSIVDKLK